MSPLKCVFKTLPVPCWSESVLDPSDHDVLAVQLKVDDAHRDDASCMHQLHLFLGHGKAIQHIAVEGKQGWGLKTIKTHHGESGLLVF